VNGAQPVEAVLVRYGRALTYDQAILIAASEATGQSLDPRHADDAAVLVRAEALLEHGALVLDAIDEAAAACSSATTPGTGRSPRTP